MVKTFERKKLLSNSCDLPVICINLMKWQAIFSTIYFFATANKFGYYTGHWTWFCMICTKGLLSNWSYVETYSYYWALTKKSSIFWPLIWKKGSVFLENAHFSNPKHFNEVCRSNYMQALEKSESAFRRCNWFQLLIIDLN